MWAGALSGFLTKDVQKAEGIHNEGPSKKKKKTRRDAHTHSLEMKLLPRTEIGPQQQRNTHKSGKRQRAVKGKEREEGEGGGSKKRDNAETTSEFFESMTPLNAVF